jgi:hypothetical protein
MLYAWEAGKVITGFRWGDQTETDRLEYLGIDGRMILKWIFKKWNEGMGGMHWIGLAQDRNRWQALLNMVMILRDPQNSENFLTS